MRRTAVINQIRGLLLERGITLRQGRRHVDEALPGILEDASAKLSGAVRLLLAQLKLELDHLQMRIDEADAVIQKIAGENEACRRLVAIPGIGPVTATAIIAAPGGLENLNLVEEEHPKPWAGELLVRIWACSLNFRDSMAYRS